jgi:hypothetical protein
LAQYEKLSMAGKFLATTICCLLLAGQSFTAASSQSRYSDEDSKSKTLSRQITIPASITYWSHDSLGYHPSIAFTMENTSGQSLLGEPIKLQAQFRLLSEGLVTIARWQTAFDTIGGRQQVNTQAHGKRAFELPLDRENWPLIECKIVCKIGDNEQAQTLLVERIEAQALSQEDALTNLNMKLGHRRLTEAKLAQAQKQRPLPPSKPPVKISHPTQPSAPANGPPPSSLGNRSAKPQENLEMLAVAQSLNSQNHGTVAPQNTAAVQSTTPSQNLLKSNNLPGLGDDFYLFEKLFGLPTGVDTRDAAWVWACYQKSPKLQFFAGSKGHSGKVDIVIAALEEPTNLTENQITTLTRNLAGKFRLEKTAPVDHCVRYASSGRTEFLNVQAQSYRATAFKTQNSRGQPLWTLAVSRLPGSLSESLREQAQKSKLLTWLLGTLGEEGENLEKANNPEYPAPKNNDRQIPSRPYQPGDLDIE